MEGVAVKTGEDHGRRRIVIVGGGGHAKVVASVLRGLPQFTAAGYVDPADRGALLGLPRLGGDDALAGLLEREGIRCAALGVGQARGSGARRRLAERLSGLGYELPALVSPSAYVDADAALGAGTVVMAGAVIQPGARCGVACIVNTGARIDHDCRLGDFVHVAPGAVLCGGVTVGDDTLLGAGCVVAPGLRVGAGCIVGAGAAVARDCADGGTYVGVPAERRP